MKYGYIIKNENGKYFDLEWNYWISEISIGSIYYKRDYLEDLLNEKEKIYNALDEPYSFKNCKVVKVKIEEADDE